MRNLIRYKIKHKPTHFSWLTWIYLSFSFRKIQAQIDTFFPGVSIAFCPSTESQTFDASNSVCYECNGRFTVVDEFTARNQVCCPKQSRLIDIYSQQSFEDCGVNSCNVFLIDLWPGRQLNQYCNGIKDCRDGIDELACGSCGQFEFRCQDGNNFKCLSATKVCDGVKNCPDGSDEKGCLAQYGDCPNDHFKCGSKNFGVEMCLPETQVCDGIKNCPDGMDEVNCVSAADDLKSSRFMCQNGNEIPAAQVCQDVSVCGDNSALIGCYTWFQWGNWVDNTCSTLCKKMRMRQCRSMVDGRVDHTAEKCMDGSIQAYDKAIESMTIPPPKDASPYEFSLDFARNCDANLYKEACQEAPPEEVCTQCLVEPVDEEDNLIPNHVSCCQGQLIDNSIEGAEQLLGNNIYGIDELGQCLREQKSFIGNLQEFKCCGACASTLNLTECGGFLFNGWCFPWWLLALIFLILLILFLILLCWWKEWLCFKKTEAGLKNLPVERHNRAAEFDSEYINAEFGEKSPAVRRATRNVVLRSAILKQLEHVSFCRRKLSLSKYVGKTHRLNKG